jgi:rRNA maturation endonuclease Nob1
VRVLYMPSWMLQCTNCQSHFKHSDIDDTGLLSYFFTPKPLFPPDGSELECPHCGHKATYQRTDLTYQA